MGNLKGITLTPIAKERNIPESGTSSFVCIISDEDDASKDSEVIEISSMKVDNKEGNQEESKNVDIEMGEDSKSIHDNVIQKQNINRIDVGDNPTNNNGNVQESCDIAENLEHKKNISSGNNENEPINLLNSNLTELNFVEDTSTSKIPTNSNLVEIFIETCNNVLRDSEYDIVRKFEVFEQYYKRCEPKLIRCPDFKQLIDNNIKKAKLSPSQAIISFGKVFMHVKDLAAVNTVEVTKKEKIKLKKLEGTIRQLVKKIKDLESAEVDFSDEEDSAYLQLDR